MSTSLTTSTAVNVLQEWQAASIEERRFLIRARGLPIAWVERPVSLETFVTSPLYLGHPPLSPIQFDFVYHLAEIFDLPAIDEQLSNVVIKTPQVQELVAVWGKGCLSGDQSVTDCITQEAMPVRDWATSQRLCNVLSTDGEVRPVCWFRCGRGPLVQVQSTSGKRLRVYRGHKFMVAGLGWSPEWMVDSRVLTVDGWERIAGIESMGEELYYDTTVPVMHNYAAGGFWNHNSGKDTCVMIGVARILYLLGCLVSPQQVFGMPEYSSIDLLNIALNEKQAAENFFDPLKRMLAQSVWFMQRLKVQIVDGAIHCPPIIDRTLGDMYAVNAWSGHSGHEAMEGKNLIVAVADEIDAFRHIQAGAGNKATQAASMYGMLSSSVSSRFPVVGKTVMISWPRYARSFIMSKLAAGREEPAVFSSGPYATWEVHPHRIKEDFERHFRTNPEDSKARYGAQPSETLEGYFSLQGAVLDAFHSEIETTDFGFSYVRSKGNPGPEPPVDEHGRVQIAHVAPPLNRIKYCWHGDLAIKHDRAAIAMAHHSGFIEDPDDPGAQLPVVTIDLVAWWEAEIGGEIDLSEIRRFILDFARRGYQVGSVTFDGFASEEMLQQLKKHDARGNRVKFNRDGNPIRDVMNAGYFSVDTNMKAYETLKGLIYETGRLQAFYCPLLVQELLSLELVRGGKKVDHPSDGSKDASDSVAGAVFNALLYLNDRAWLRRGGIGAPTAIVGGGVASSYEPNEEPLVSTAITKVKSRRGFG